ncbi:MAG: hypothetical protein WD768_09255 [Phycisphaeraceae bacterium]
MTAADPEGLEYARKGDAVYDRDVRDKHEPQDIGRFVLIDIDSGMYEVDADQIAATHRLLERAPNARIWIRQVGRPYAHRVGYRASMAYLMSTHREAASSC